MCITDHVHNTPRSQQTMFATDHVHHRPHLFHTTLMKDLLITDHVHNRPCS